MYKLLNKKRKGEEGFTLIELVVVIAILGILIAIAVPIFTGTLSDATTATEEANVRTFESAAALYLSETGNYPAGANSSDGFFVAVGVLEDADYLTDFPTEFTNITVTGYDQTTGDVTYSVNP